jgi:Xaa-Pro aminopeptidase
MRDAEWGAEPSTRPTNDVFAERCRALLDLAAGEGVAATFVYGNTFAVGGVRYLTGFTPRRDCYLYLGGDTTPTLYVQFFNHVPNAREVTAVAAVEWGGPSSVGRIVERVRGDLGGSGRVGLIGPIPYQDHRRLVDELEGFELVDLGPPFWKTRLIKQAPEIEWTRRGAELTDQALAHLVGSIIPGVSERQLGAAVTAYCAAAGGHVGICFLLTTSMSGEGRYVPAQEWSGRIIQPGDMVVVELSAGYAGHTGQVLRTITVGEPLPRIIELHEIAEEAFAEISSRIHPGARASELLEAARAIDDAGVTVCDDVVHGYGGGYLQPVLRTPASQHGPYSDIELQPGMMVVVQPNVVSPDLSIGVQTGELLIVTDDGYESMHGYPRGIVVTGS